MINGAAHAIRTAVFEATSIGQSVADVSCCDADLAIALAATGRRVWTFATTDRALAQIAAAEPETRRRIVASTRSALDGERVHPPFDALVLIDALTRERDPIGAIRELQARCSPQAHMFLRVPNGARNACDGDTWTIHEAIVSDVFAPLGEVTVCVPSERTALCIEIVPRRMPAADRVRMAAVVQLVPQDRWINDALTMLDTVAAYVIAYGGDRISERSLRIVRNHPRVLSVCAPDPQTPGSDGRAEALRRARAWLPGWLFSLDSSSVLAPETPAALHRALRAANPSTSGFSLDMRLLWDRDDRYRIDVPAAYAEHVCIAREGRFTRTVCERLDARVFDYQSFDGALRAAERAVSFAAERLGYPAPGDPWTAASTASTATLSAPPFQTESAALLAAATAADTGEVARGLCLDAVGFDAARILKARWPAATFTLFAPPQRRVHPQFTAYSFTIADDIAAIDVDLVCGKDRFDIVVDAAATPDPEPGRARLHQARRALTTAGRLYALFDDGTGSETLERMLAARAFSDAGFAIAAIASTQAESGERATIVCAYVARRPQHAHHALTIVVPLDAADDADDDFWQALVTSVDGYDVAVVAAPFSRGREPAKARDLPPGTIRVVAYEPALDAAIARAYAHAPANAICVLPPNTALAADWCGRVVERLRTPDLGYLALDDTIAAVSIAAVDPLAWPRNFTDERLRAGVLRGIVSRRGFREERISGIVTGRRPPARVRDELAQSERARARAAGMPSEPVTSSGA